MSPEPIAPPSRDKHPRIKDEKFPPGARPLVECPALPSLRSRVPLSFFLLSFSPQGQVLGECILLPYRIPQIHRSTDSFHSCTRMLRLVDEPFPIHFLPKLRAESSQVITQCYLVLSGSCFESALPGVTPAAEVGTREMMRKLSKGEAPGSTASRKKKAGPGMWYKVKIALQQLFSLPEASEFECAAEG